MRRYLTLVCLLFLAIPAGISISGCYRNPAAAYCNGVGYGMKITDLDKILFQQYATGISMAFGQTRNLGLPQAENCKDDTVNVSSFSYGSTNRQFLDISPSGNMCAGTWNRNTGGGIADYTICSKPNPLPSTNGLPYGTAFVTASAQSVSSNPVEVFVHAAVSSVALVGPQSCLSQYQTATLDAQACYTDSNNQQVQMCAPATTQACPYKNTDPRCNNASLYYVCPGGVPKGASIPNCTASIGTLTYTSASSIGLITTDTTDNIVTLTAEQPGTTSITASVAGTGSSAGYFTVCPPKSISLTLANGGTTGTIPVGSPTQNLVTSVYDSNVASCPPTNANPVGGCPLSGPSLDYQSTDPMDISVDSSGAVTVSFPGVASIYAICQPGSCNSGPLNMIGEFGTDLSLSSNPVIISTPPSTASDYIWFSSPGQSQYFVPVELLSGTVGSPVRMPYVPNSMIMDRLGTNLYFGSPHELMIYSTNSNTLTTQNPSVPGVVLAVSPNNSQLLINDQARQLFYLYTINGAGITTFGGMGNAAAWTPDSKTLYITDNASLNNPAAGITGHTDTLYVYNQNNWTTYKLKPSTLSSSLPPGVLPITPGQQIADTVPVNVAISSTVQTPALIIPSVGAFLRGSPTEDHTWCPSGTVGDYNSISFYPQPDSVAVQSDTLASTTDGKHILGAAVTSSGFELSDIGVDLPAVQLTPEISVPISCPEATNAITGVETLLPLTAGPWLNATQALDPTKAAATAVNQVIPSPESNLAFITYTAEANNTATAAQLPYYLPNANASSTSPKAGTVEYLQLTTQTGGTTPIAPLAGAFTPDSTLFFVSTAGDNMIHYINIPAAVSATNPPTDTQQISPNLPACTSVSQGGVDAGCTYPGNGNGEIVPATAIAVKPRSTT